MRGIEEDQEGMRKREEDRGGMRERRLGRDEIDRRRLGRDERKRWTREGIKEIRQRPTKVGRKKGEVGVE